MRKLLQIFSFFIIHFITAQNVIFNKIVKVNENEDKFLYKITPEESNAEYLGEIEVQGFSNNDAEVFNKVYKKAKEIGANAFSYKPMESIEGTLSKFDAWNYKMNLFYLPKEKFPKENNIVYIFAPASKDQTISFNGEILKFKARSFTKKQLKPGETYTISTRRLLGSSIKLSASKDQPVQHFQLFTHSLSANQSGEGGISFKTGNIVLLEKSFADFLSMIYNQF